MTMHSQIKQKENQFKKLMKQAFDCGQVNREKSIELNMQAKGIKNEIDDLKNLMS